jgi:hypothetical protein
MSTPTPQHAAALAAAQLRRSQGLALVAFAFSLAALAGLPSATTFAALRWALIALTVVALYLGARVALDATVFRQWAGQKDLPVAMAHFDSALVRWRLRRATAPTRDLTDRIDGALRWRRALLACAAVQTLCAAALWISEKRPFA